MVRKQHFSLFVALAAPLFAAPAWADTKIGVIDMQHAVSETNEGARAIDGLRKLSDKRQNEIESKRTQLGKDKAELDRKCQSKALSKEQCDQGLEELQRKLVELQTLMGEYQGEFQKKQGESTQPIVTKMLAIVRRIAQREGYDLVIDKAVAHFQREGFDVTDAAIKIYNTESGVAPLPASAGQKSGGKGPAKK